jgi:hypothetical protein
MEHSSCLMSLACHPVNPSLVACGSFNGEVLVFDLSLATREAASASLPSCRGGIEGGSAGNEEGDDANNASSAAADPLVFASRIDDFFHREPVRWVMDFPTESLF